MIVGLRADVIKLIAEIGDIAISLSELLNLKFVEGHLGLETHIGKSIKTLLNYQHQAHQEDIELDLFKLKFLAHQLKRFEEKNPSLLSHYRRRFIQAGSTDSYYGTRFEINVLSSLLDQGVNAVQRERPDIDIPQMNVAIECTSARVENNKIRKDLTYKICAAIRKKSSKGYANRRTAAFVDITNVVWNSTHFDTGVFRQSVEGCAGDSEFGAVLLFIYMMNNDLDRYESNYIRIDHAEADPGLRKH